MVCDSACVKQTRSAAQRSRLRSTHHSSRYFHPTLPPSERKPAAYNRTERPSGQESPRTSKPRSTSSLHRATRPAGTASEGRRCLKRLWAAAQASARGKAVASPNAFDGERGRTLREPCPKTLRLVAAITFSPSACCFWYDAIVQLPPDILLLETGVDRLRVRFLLSRICAPLRQATCP